MAYKTCVTIAETERAGVLSQLAKAMKRADYAELRLDFLSKYEVPGILEDARGYMDRCVCTIRPQSDMGGRFVGTEDERLGLLEVAAGYGPMFLDVEYQTLKGDPRFLDSLRGKEANILVSYHDWEGTPSEDALRGKMRQMLDFSKNVKIATTARRNGDALRVLSLYECKPEECSLIAFAMGDAGRLSRVACMEMGAPYTYVTMKKEVAPGQFRLDDMKELIRLLQR